MSPPTEQVLLRAANALGGSEALARHLQVEHATLRMWMRGQAPPPEDLLQLAEHITTDRIYKGIRSTAKI
jgi:hypothetical protein